MVSKRLFALFVVFADKAAAAATLEPAKDTAPSMASMGGLLKAHDAKYEAKIEAADKAAAAATLEPAKDTAPSVASTGDLLKAHEAKYEAKIEALMKQNEELQAHVDALMAAGGKAGGDVPTNVTLAESTPTPKPKPPNPKSPGCPSSCPYCTSGRCSCLVEPTTLALSSPRRGRHRATQLHAALARCLGVRCAASACVKRDNTEVVRFYPSMCMREVR
jgi:hypothetical protein